MSEELDRICRWCSRQTIRTKCPECQRDTVLLSDPVQKFYRYSDMQFGTVDGDFAWPGRVEIMLEEFGMISETPKGWHIMLNHHPAYGATTRWISKTSKKKYAYPTEDEAWNSFKARKRAQIRIYETRLRQAQIALEMPRPKGRRLS